MRPMTATSLETDAAALQVHLEVYVGDRSRGLNGLTSVSG
jgi:hypothetical protein